MEKVKVKIRGIYATALTALLLEKGIAEIISPSPVIRERFGLEAAEGEEEVRILTRRDGQGIFVEGERDKVEIIASVLREEFPQAIFRFPKEAARSLEELKGARLSWEEFISLKLGRTSFEMEMPLNVKREMDEIRRRITFTVPDHHYLKCVNSVEVDKLEEEFAQKPEEAGMLASSLKEKLVYSSFTADRVVPISHVKISGEKIELHGKVLSFSLEDKMLKLKRAFKGGGVYDGLEVPKEEGDYGYVELREGEWFCRRSYYAADGTLKGFVYNINTPIEFYPGRVRYIDLEVDVVCWPDGRVEIIDREKLEEKVESKAIRREFFDFILELAEDLKRKAGSSPLL